MVSVIINGANSELKANTVDRMGDLVELIKTFIDPDHIITSLMLNGNEFSEADWTANITSLGTAIVEVETDTPSRFVEDRMAQAADIVRACFFEFRDARKLFQDGKMIEGNKELLKAVDTLQAFFQWFGTMLELVENDQRAKYDITTQTRDISEVCKRICQQQLYQSWWALGETLKSELEPKLDALEDHCRKFNAQV